MNKIINLNIMVVTNNHYLKISIILKYKMCSLVTLKNKIGSLLQFKKLKQNLTFIRTK